MKSIFRKSLLVVALLIGGFLYSSAYDHIGVAAGTIEIGTISKAPGAGSRFAKFKDGAYIYRGAAWSYSNGKGIKTQNSNSGVVFYLANSADITITIKFDASKNFANVDAHLKKISDSDYDKFFTGIENNTTVTFTSSEYETKTVVIDKKGDFQETFPAMPAGYYFMTCTGTGSNTYFTQLIVGESSTPVTPTVSSVTINPSSATLNPNDTKQLSVTVDATPASADKSVTWTSSNPSVATVSESGLVTAVAQGTATITATSNLDNTKSGTCSVTVNAPAAPIPVTAIALNKSTANIAIGDSETLTINYTPADANTGKAVTWTSSNTSVATVDNSGKVTGIAAGSATITATSTTDASITASCAVAVQAVAVTGVSINPTSANLQIGGSTDLTYTILPANATDKSVSWSSSNTSVVNVNNGHVTAIAAGTATITVTTTDGSKTATCSVTVTAGPPVPQTDLTLHEPEVYNASESEGGYGGTLKVVDGREFEVYYMTRDGESEFCIATTNADKTIGITTRTSGDYACKANDGWFKFSATGWSSSSDAMGGEFGTMARRLDMDNSCEFTMYISGFDQFAIVARDKKQDTSSGQTKPDDNKYLEVYIDDVLQPRQFNSNPSVRRYEVTSSRHVIRIIHHGGDKSAMYAFSLRVAQEPRVKYIDGNDSTQAVWAGRDLKPVTYFTKYNNMGQTLLTWEGAEATGISLTKAGSDEIGDTLILKGTAACPAGEYHYRVESFTSAGIKTTSIAGKFTVKTQISFMNLADTTLEVYQSEEMDPILFSYYANSVDDITLDWGGKAPVGITGTGANGRYSLAGTPQTVDTFNYTLSVAGGNTIKGQLIVLELNLGDNPVLYLQSDRDAYKQDGIYAYLNNNGYNLIPRVAQSGLRKPEQYAMYNWILISEDADADNGEVLAVTREGANRPVLNMKSFSYAPGRLDWGEPNKGSVSDEGRFITVTRGDHPIFQALHKKQGDRIMVLDTVIRRGLMPIDVHLNGTLCLATALKGDIEDYFADGEPATFLHEIPASMRGGYKYICMPIGISSSKKLTSDGKKLLEAVISYLLSDEQTVLPPTLQITDFRIGDLVGDIDEATNTITININRSEYPEIDLSSVVPTVTLADPNNTFLVPDENEPVDLEWTKWIPVYYTVTDHVGQRTYTIVVNIYSPEGIEEVYSAGEWVNIFDIYGRKVATTNEDIYSMPLPHGMYIVVTENGQTLKIMR